MKTLRTRPDSTYCQLLEEFYGHLHKIFGFRAEVPEVFFIPDKTVFNSLVKRVSADWEIGYAKDDAVYFLELDAIRATKAHKNYSVADLAEAIKHEAAHIYFNRLTKKVDDRKMPRWLSEGLAVYWSGQYGKRGSIKKFGHLNDPEPAAMKYHYGEGGTAVQILIATFGIEKLKNLFDRLGREKDASNFEAVFVDVYGFLPTDEEFNLRLPSE